MSNDETVRTSESVTREALYDLAMELSQMTVWAWDLRGRRIEDAVPSQILVGQQIRAALRLPVGAESGISWEAMLERVGILPSDRVRGRR